MYSLGVENGRFKAAGAKNEELENTGRGSPKMKGS